MCGLNGWLYLPGAEPAPDTLMRMSQTIRHRGPDDEGTFRAPAAGFAVAHRRLSIIDLSADSHQPMVDEATGVVLAYNGELYNFRDLRHELQGRGHQFRSQGDTEVVLRSYIEWGTGCFARFAGMFALAIWDARSATLHLARDAMGMKPLYCLERTEGVAFASEVKAFRALPGFDAQVDPSALTQYLEFGYVFETQRTILSGVRKVDPGHRLELRAGKIVRDEAWFVPPVPDAADLRGEHERLHELASVMDKVVGEHLIADVPLGLLLSGGLDSSLIAALAARRGPLLTISMAFDGSAVDERPFAREVSRHVGSRHVEVLVTADDVKREAMEGAWVFDDLFADWGTLTTRLLYRRCREQGIKAVLVGEGADELFGGYDVFRAPERLGLWQQFRLYQRYAGRRHGRLFGPFRRVIGNYLEAGQGDAFNAIRLFESRRQLPNQYVMKVDKASMAESVESRTPFLDRRVAELAYRTPREWLLRGGENKYLLRALGRRDNLLPASTSSRPKFGAPLSADWMDADPAFRKFARERVLDGQWGARAGLKDAMTLYFDKGRAGYGFPRAVSLFRNAAWRILLLELWAQHYVKA
ncbi:MAG TPA: asparagine synthase (glutamine-hydrolyzing) [Ramlibacter sp.]|nr:asparagine synthase (glutamine-hydrolyzing) [Ramlibacter sp.]